MASPLEPVGQPGSDPIAQRVAEIIGAKREFFRNAFTALDFNGISGDYVEFGSYGGVTMMLAHQETAASAYERQLWAFDSFKGLPRSEDPRDAHGMWVPGSMSMSLESFTSTLADRGVPASAYQTVAGYFEDSLPALGATGGPRDIALAYVDCDMYSSTISVLEFLAPRLKHGMIMGFDDYFCWTANGLSGERNALDEFRSAHPEWSFHRYRDIFWGGVSFVVERVDV